MIALSVQEQGLNDFAFRLSRIQQLVHRGLVDPEIGTLPKQAQLLTERCMELTPPFAGKNGTKLEGVKAREVGERAVARDISSVIKGRDKGFLEFLVDLQGSRTIVNQELKTKTGRTYVVDVDRIDLDGSEIVPWHKRHRDKRGRVLRATSKSNDKTIGRWRSRDTLWTPAENFKAYIKRVQGRVGSAKAGWLLAYIGLGGKRAPDWILRHGMGHGTFIDGTKTPDNPTITVGNQTKWGLHNDESGRAVSKAIRDRAMRMNTYFNTMMRLASEGKLTPWQIKTLGNDAA